MLAISISLPQPVLHASLDWRPSASLHRLAQRGELLAAIRRYFQANNALEVDTPALVSNSSLDAHIVSPNVDQDRYLHSSAEPAMKRLLAAGSGDIYQLSHVFRGNEQGRWHNSEFMLLEWYRVGITAAQLRDEVTALLRYVVQQCRWSQLSCEVVSQGSYQQAFMQHCQLDPLSCSIRDIQARCADAAPALASDDRDGWLDWLASSHVFPHLGFAQQQPALHYVTEFPASQAALARLTTNSQGQPVADRFELFINGVELANGYYELRNAAEQRARLGNAAANNQRFLAALEHGMPDCSGVALGVDRLLALMTGADCLADVMPFDFERI